jgi:hypothetical protein
MSAVLTHVELPAVLEQARAAAQAAGLAHAGSVHGWRFHDLPRVQD